MIIVTQNKFVYKRMDNVGDKYYNKNNVTVLVELRYNEFQCILQNLSTIKSANNYLNNICY